MTSAPDHDDIGDYVICARSLDEYTAFFGLTPADRGRRILDCPGGAASVVAELTAAGGRAVAVDPVYALHADVLHEQARPEAARSELWSF